MYPTQSICHLQPEESLDLAAMVGGSRVEWSLCALWRRSSAYTFGFACLAYELAMIDLHAPADFRRAVVEDLEFLTELRYALDR
jgi:hypothetical protein